jgi:lipopolysaccharide export system ATP-binding protein
VLLIIVMLIAPLLQKGIDVTLPEAVNTTEKADNDSQTTLAVTADGRFYVDEVQVSEQDMLREVQEVLERKFEKIVLIKADQDAQYSNVMAILETLDLTAAERRERLSELLHSLGLEGLAKQKAFTLSGGERRRLEITRALVTDPAFIMLDEPFSGVDPIAVQDVQNIVARLKDMGLGILITDHSVRETLAIVNRAYLIFEGKILCEGDRDFLINDEQAKAAYLGPDFEA